MLFNDHIHRTFLYIFILLVLNVGNGWEWGNGMMIITLWLFNIAMENPNHKWRFLAGKIIYEWAIYTMAM